MSKFLDKAPDIRDLEIQSRLDKIHEKNGFFNRGDNNIFFPSNSPPPPLGPPPLSPPSNLFNISNVPRVDEFLNNNDFNFDFSNGYASPASDPPPLRGFARTFFRNGPSTAKTSSNVGTNRAKTSSNVGANMTQAMRGDRLIGELDRVIDKEKPKEEFVPDENIVFSLPKIPTIFDNEDLELKQEIKNQKDDEINEEIDLTRLKDEIDGGEIPK